MGEHSIKYETVLKMYRMHKWNENMVRNAVVKGWITMSEFTEITGKQY